MSRPQSVRSAAEVVILPAASGVIGGMGFTDRRRQVETMACAHSHLARAPELSLQQRA